VTHAGGTAAVTLNQKQNGGAWVALGAWDFAPSSGHKVTLTASAEPAPGLDPGGTTIADALLFVGSGAQPANLLYVHADHLGSPQKLTDAGQAVVWDGVFDPFGREVALAGLAAMPLRFPGQYADPETGYSYNYFRDYEPRLGRYIQSDPIGLYGGINTYAYAGHNAVNWIDPMGLDPSQMTMPTGFASGNIQLCLNPGGGGGLHPCDQGFYRCIDYGHQLHDKGYVDESNELYMNCRATQKQCYANEDIVQSNPNVIGGQTYFPPNKHENGGGYVDHSKGERPVYIPPFTDPISPLPPNPNRP
jgi:RHS repeat-associated protein